ncbi:MAG: FtsQ-type POTRA domain-containing protein [Acidiphilium sp.]|jgi:cell division protein FtsQ|uniref:cell division protein FtsQ/DivIB n=1 Tax=Acidiphilium acidophilum TaxID=76588 RepID=UPI002A0F0140|nr:FtsQ-type POTRA domain-containing protein [Acidiphilium sp.]MEE3500861.1 cell division protein FtsQ/DivIB [Acidiphilium acidophilum]
MSRVKTRKPKIQDRPSARTLLLRRFRKSGKPALIGAIVIVVLVVVPLGVRGITALFRPVHAGFADLMADGGMRVAHIEIDGATTTPRVAVERALGVRHGMPILGFSPEAAARRIAALGAVRSATVERILPDTIRVEVVERRPVAIWQEPDNRFALIGPDGTVLDGHDAAAARAHDPDLPLLVGAGVPGHAAALLALLKRYPAIAKHVVAAERIDDLRWNLLLRDHTTIKLPDQHEGAAMARLVEAEDRIKLLERPVRTIDLRLADRLVVRPYPKGFITDAAAAPGHPS